MTSTMKTNTPPDAKQLIRDALKDVRPDLLPGYDAGNISDGAALAYATLSGKKPKAEDEAINATDAARALAAEYDVALAEIEGTGVDGKIVVADVQAVIDAREPA